MVFSKKWYLGSVVVNTSDSHARGWGVETRQGKCGFSNDGSKMHYLNIPLHLVVSLYKLYKNHQMAQKYP